MTAGRRPAAAAARTREQIVHAALALFADHGYEPVSLRDVAAAAGVSHGLLRHHFGSKDFLWRAVVAEADARYVAALPDELPGGAGEPGALSAATQLVRGLVVASARHPEVPRLLLREGAVPSERLDHVLERMRPLRERSEAILRELHYRGRLTEYGPASFFLLLLTAVTTPFALSGLTERVLGADPLDEREIQRHADRLLALLDLTSDATAGERGAEPPPA